LKKLWAITSYFNPVGYARRLQNYLAFRKHLAIPLVTVELAYRDDFDLPPDAGDILIRLRARTSLAEGATAQSGACGTAAVLRQRRMAGL
jgi:hypothetical protein